MSDIYLVTPTSASVGRTDAVVIPAVGNVTWNISALAPDLSTQAYYWTPEWQAGEREADADIEAGRVYDFVNIDEALEWLHSDED